MRFLALYLLVAVALGGCERKLLDADPIGVPPEAIVLIAAPTLREMREMSQYVEQLDVVEGKDEQAAAWFACEPGLCVLRRDGASPLKQEGDRWTVPDGNGSLVVWGAADRAALDAALARWRQGEPAPVASGWKGFVEPGPLLQRWQPANPRAKELVDRVTFQAGRIDFDVKVSPTVVDAELRMRSVPGEPQFVGDLGEARADAPSVMGLTDPGMLGMVRLSANPEEVWHLLRSVLDAEQRGALDAFVTLLESEAAVTLDPLLASLSGHLYVMAYGLEPDAQHRPVDWLRLDATHEVVVIPILERLPIRRAFDAWTQLSAGRLQVQTTASGRQEWAWFEDDTIRWTAILDDDYLLIVDSSVALDAVRRWQVAPGNLAASLKSRGVDELLLDRSRSGAYVDLAALRALLGKDLDDVLPGVRAITLSTRKEAGHEVIGVRLTLQ